MLRGGTLFVPALTSRRSSYPIVCLVLSAKDGTKRTPRARTVVSEIGSPRKRAEHALPAASASGHEAWTCVGAEPERESGCDDRPVVAWLRSRGRKVRAIWWGHDGGWRGGRRKRYRSARASNPRGGTKSRIDVGRPAARQAIAQRWRFRVLDWENILLEVRQSSMRTGGHR